MESEQTLDRFSQHHLASLKTASLLQGPSHPKPTTVCLTPRTCLAHAMHSEWFNDCVYKLSSVSTLRNPSKSPAFSHEGANASGLTQSSADNGVKYP